MTSRNLIKILILFVFTFSFASSQFSVFKPKFKPSKFSRFNHVSSGNSFTTKRTFGEGIITSTQISDKKATFVNKRKVESVKKFPCFIKEE